MDAASNDLQVQLPAQLTHHLRTLRRRKGWNQAQLGAALGVGQARIARIEQDPGSISVEQLLRILGLLDTRVLLRAREGASRACLPPDPAGLDW